MNRLSLLAALILASSASLAETTAPKTEPAAQPFFAQPATFTPAPVDQEQQKAAFKAHRDAMQAHAEQVRTQHEAFFKAQRDRHIAVMEAQKKAADAHFAMIRQMHGLDAPVQQPVAQ